MTNLKSVDCSGVDGGTCNHFPAREEAAEQNSQDSSDCHTAASCQDTENENDSDPSAITKPARLASSPTVVETSSPSSSSQSESSPLPKRKHYNIADSKDCHTAASRQKFSLPSGLASAAAETTFLGSSSQSEASPLPKRKFGCDHPPSHHIVDSKGDSKFPQTVPITSDSLPREATMGWMTGIRSERAVKLGVAGATGLRNLGNTCYMNSVLQCLSHTQDLRDYFSRKEFVPHINPTNPIGCEGKLAYSFAVLVEDLWSEKYTVVAPTNLKYTVGKYQHTFNGFAQQDAHEFLTFLLDRLHEDVNLVTDKPYFTEPDDAPQLSDDEASQLAWHQYLQRNNSKVVDLFAGQLKIHMTCNVCKKDSTVFETFTSLAVPMQTLTQLYYVVPVHFHPADLTKPVVKCAVKTLKTSPVSEVIKEVRTLLEIPDTVHIHASSDLQQPFDERYDCIGLFEFNPPESQVAEESANDQPGTGEDKEEMAEEQKISEGPFFVSASFNMLVGGRYEKYECCFTATDKGSNMYYEAYRHAPITFFKTDGTEFEATPTTGEDDYVFYPASSPQERKGRCCGMRHFHVEFSCNAKVEQRRPESVVHESYGLIAKWSDMKYRSRPELTLQDCLEQHNMREQLDDDNTYYCSGCKDRRCAFRQMTVWKLPKYLVVHLKRFSYSMGYWGGHRRKLDTPVSYPVEELDMNPYLSNPTDSPIYYRLYGVVQHYGSAAGGHYTSLVLNRTDGNWYSCDDSRVSQLRETPEDPTAAYLLFYERKE